MSVDVSKETKKSDTWPIFGRLLKMLRPWWGKIAVGVLFLFLSMPGEVFPALGWRFVVDDIALDKRGESPWLTAWFSFGGTIQGRYAMLVSAVTWMFVVYVSCELFGAIETNILNRIAQQFILKLRNQVYHKLQSQSLGYLQRQRTGDLMSRALSDVDELQSFIVNSIDTILGEGILWLITVAIVMSMSWKVASVSLAPLLLVYVLLRYFNKWIKPIYKTTREKMGEVSTRIQENLSGIVTIKIFGREKQEAARFAATTEEYYDQQIKAINARTLFFPFSRVVGFFSNVFMIGFGGYYYLKDGSFTIGTLVAFRAYWWRLFGPIQTLARVNDMVQRAVAAGRRVFEVLDAPDDLPDVTNARMLGDVRGEMEIRDVDFAYASESAKTGAAVLKGVNVRIEAAKTIALCGPSGGGKSTILNLLLRFYDPVSGVVTLDGIDLREIQRENLRKHFALVQQETFLFNDSILDNIRYGHPEATMQQVVAAAQAANAHSFIEQFPNGYETRVGERGIRLSGGQKQRISIARGFLANPRILLLDEPTSNVEPDSEAAIIAALDRLMAGRTTVLTSHRPSLINQADIVYVVENGQITESGPPITLRQNGGWFANFMRSAEEAVI